MSKLTAQDIATLKTFFASPVGVAIASEISAQSYEPRGKSGYDPSTDTRLAHLVLRGVRSGKSAWTIASCVIDQLCGRPGGSAHLAVLQQAMTSRASVGCHTARAMAYGRELAKDAARLSELESEYRTCGYRGFTSIHTAMRVLALDAKLRHHTLEVSLGAVAAHAFEAVADRLINVDDEIDTLIAAAVDALHEARERAQAADRAAKAREEKRCADLRADLAGKRAAKETARYERRLRAAS